MSTVREHYAEDFRPALDERPNRFVWLGTTRPFPAFTFYFKRDQHGLWRVHAYQYEQGRSTFIVEAAEATWRQAGLDTVTEDDTVAFCEALFKDELKGHRLLKNRSLWRHFVTIKNASWSYENVVLVGDAAHTAHFSVGSGTKLAIEDAIALAAALQRRRHVPDALAEYEAERRPAVESRAVFLRVWAPIGGLSAAAVEAIVRAGDGSLRDTQSVLEQVLAFAESSEGGGERRHIAAALEHLSRVTKRRFGGSFYIVE